MTFSMYKAAEDLNGAGTLQGPFHAVQHDFTQVRRRMPLICMLQWADP